MQVELIRLVAIAVIQADVLALSTRSAVPSLADVDGLESQMQQWLTHLLTTAGLVMAALHLSVSVPMMPLNHPPLDLGEMPMMQVSRTSRPN
jgi:hypothetical protein